MALNSLGLGIVLTAKDMFSSVFQKMEKGFLRLDGASDDFVQKMERNGRQLKVGMAMMGVGVAGLATSFHLANKAGEFEGSLTTLQVLFKANTEQMGKFRDSILDADKSIFSPVESSEALQEFAKRGFTATQAMEMFKPALDLATASMGQLGVKEAAVTAGEAIHAFSLQASDAKRMVDQMTTAATMSGMSFRELPLGIGQAARGAQAANQTFEETLIALGMVRNVLPTIERSSNAVAVAMERMVGGTKGSQQLQAMVDVFDKGTGKVRGFRQILMDLLPKLDAMSIKSQKAFMIKAFGTRGLSGAQAVLSQLRNGIDTKEGGHVSGQAMIDYQNAKLGNSGGSAAAIADARLNTLPGQIALVKADIDRLEVVLGGPFAAALKPLVIGFGQLVTNIKNFWRGIPENVQKGIAQFVLFGSALATVVGAMLAGSALMTLFGVTLGGIAAAALSVAAPLAIVGAVIAGAILMFKAFEVSSEQSGKGVIGFVTDMAHKVSLGFQGLMQLFKEGAFSGAVMNELDKAENGGVKAFAIKIYLWVNRIKNFLTGLADGFRAKIRDLQPTFDRLVDAVKFLAEAFGLSVGAAKDNQAAFDSAGQSGNELGATLAAVAGIISNLLTVGIMAAYGALEVFKAGWKGIGPIVIAVASIIWGAIQLIAGALSGDATLAWKGFFNLVYGGIKLLFHMLMLLPKMLTMAYDAVNNSFIGRWAGTTKSTSNKDLNWGIKEYDKLIDQRHAEGLAEVGIKPSSAPAMPKASPTAPSISPAVSAVQATMPFGLGGLLESMKAPAAQTQPIYINLKSALQLDGETLARAIQQIKTDNATRGFHVVDTSGINM